MSMPPELAIGTLKIVRDLSIEVGRKMVELGDELRTSTSKGAGVDVVTKADAFSEKEITTALAGHFPEHRIAGEEGTRLGPESSEWTWHIDPLDGTGNYSRGLPYWAISIGLSRRSADGSDQPVLGVVHGPACGLSVHGAVGLGAWWNDAPLPRATPVGPPKEWLIATDWPWDLIERQRTCAMLVKLAPQIRQYKTFGSAAVDFAHLVVGKVDAYAISKIFPWDQAGGAAIAKALGYELRRWSGEPWDLRHPDIIACRPGMWPILGEAVG